MNHHSDQRLGSTHVFRQGLASRLQASLTAILLTLTLLFGLAYSFWMAKNADRDLRNDLLTQTKLLSAAIAPDMAAALSGNDNDLARPEYQRLKITLQILQKQTPEFYFLYLARHRPDNTTIILADNAAPDSPDYAPPGTAYSEASPAFAKAVKDGVDMIEGPATDRWGTWFTALVPIVDPRTGDHICSFGADIAAADWYVNVLLAGLPGLALTALLAATLVLVPRFCLQERHRIRPSRIREGLTTFICGLLLTAFFTWQLHNAEQNQRQLIFNQLATSQSDLVAQKFGASDFIELEGLADFFATRDQVSKEEFKTYTRHLQKKTAVQLWGWIEAVKAENKTSFELEQSRRLGCDFRIIEPGNQGLPIPVKARDTYYPLLLFAPDQVSNSSLGYDLGHEKNRLQALHEAARTGLATSSRPVLHGFQTEGVKGLTIFYPVYDPGQEKLLRGFATAAMRLADIFGNYQQLHKQIHLSFWLLDADGNRELIVSQSPQGRHLRPDTFMRPLTPFGLNFLLTAHPGDAFLQAYPLWRTWIAAGAGLALTVMLATIVSMISRRHLELQNVAAASASQLSLTEERFNQLLIQTKTVLWECNLDGLITNIKPQKVNIYGKSPEEIIGKMHCTDFHPAPGKEDFERQTREIFATRRRFFNFLSPVELEDGSTAMVAFSGMPVIDEQGAVHGYYGWNHDVTEHVRLNERLRKSQAEAEAANRAKSDFLANMSHEVRTPINGIIGFIDLLQDTSLTREQREYLDLISSSSRQLLMLVNEILDYTRQEAGQTVVLEEDFNLAKMLEDTARNIALTAMAKKLEVVAVIPPDLPAALHGDGFHLQQIILNLASNAIKFTDQGEVVISVRRLWEEDNNISLRFAVRDTGIGLNAEQQNRIFDVFFQVDPSVKRKQGGVGLGLAIVKNLLARMGSEIQVESTPGQGSEFHFALTFRKQAGNQNKTKLTCRTAVAPILVVDDNPTVLHDLLARLNHHQLTAVGAEDVASARQRWAELQAAGRPPKLLLVDLGLPESAAPEYGGLLPDAARDGVPVLGLIPLAGRNSLALSLAQKVSHILTKPIYSHELFQAITVMAEKHSHARGRNQSQSPVPTVDSTDGAPPTPVPTAPVPGLTPMLDGTAVVQKPGADVAETAAPPILLAEDNSVNQKVVFAILKKLGYAADLATNGFEVLERLRHRRYQLILMDVQMPGMDGLEATRLIRNPNTRILVHDTPVIALTAHAVEGYRDICQQAGMNDYVTKPITLKQIQQVLDRWLPKTS